MKQRWISVVVAVLVATQGSVPARAQTADAIPAVTPATPVPETPAESPALHPSTRRPSHADSLAFRRVSGSVGQRTRLRVLSAKGTFETRGSEVTLQGIRRGPAPGEPGGSAVELVSWSEIEQVRVRGNAAGRGAMIGGVTLGVIGLGLGILMSTDAGCVGLSPCETSAGQIAAATFGFATAGALLGTLIGAPATKWRTIHSWAGF